MFKYLFIIFENRFFLYTYININYFIRESDIINT